MNSRSGSLASHGSSSSWMRLGFMGSPKGNRFGRDEFPGSAMRPGGPVSSAEHIQGMPGDGDLENVGRPIGDQHAALITPELLDRQFGRESDTAVELHASICSFKGFAVTEVLHHVGFRANVLAAIVFPRCV